VHERLASDLFAMSLPRPERREHADARGHHERQLTP
jgi:hypothetical protein